MACPLSLWDLSLFDCATRKTKDFFQEVGVDVRIPVKCSTNESLGKNPIGFNPTNQTTNVGKIPKDYNPSKIP